MFPLVASPARHSTHTILARIALGIHNLEVAAGNLATNGECTMRGVRVAHAPSDGTP
eukprot:SAG11_NODE_1183_length_5593_cov_7.174190_2_plen_57_part_00